MLRVALLSLLFAAGCATGKRRCRRRGRRCGAGWRWECCGQRRRGDERRVRLGRPSRRRCAVAPGSAGAASEAAATPPAAEPAVSEARRGRRRRRSAAVAGGAAARREPAVRRAAGGGNRGRWQRRRRGQRRCAASRAGVGLDRRRRHGPEPGRRRSRQRTGDDDRRDHAAVPQPEAVARQRDGAAVHADQRRALDGAARRAAAHDHDHLPEPVSRQHLRRDAFTPRWATSSPRWRCLRGRRDFVSTQTEVGEAGQPISVIQKGATDTGTTGRAYAASLFEVAAIARLAKAQGKTLRRGRRRAHPRRVGRRQQHVRERHGDALDQLQPRPAAADGTDVRDPDAAVAAALESDGRAASTSTATIAQWKIGVDHPGDIICTGPKYQYSYVSDYTHLINKDYERLGEKDAQVFYQRVVLGNDWQPLQPTGASRSGRVITVTLQRAGAAARLGHDAADAAPGEQHRLGAGQGVRGVERDHAGHHQQRRDRRQQRPDHRARAISPRRA